MISAKLCMCADALAQIRFDTKKQKKTGDVPKGKYVTYI